MNYMMFNPLTHYHISAVAKFYADEVYTNEDITKKITDTLNEYKLLMYHAPPLNNLEQRLEESKEALVTAISEGLKAMDRNHASMMVFIIKHYDFKLIRGYKWTIANVEYKPKPGMWGYKP